MSAIWKYLIKKFQKKKFLTAYIRFCPFLVFKYLANNTKTNKNSKIAKANMAMPPRLLNRLFG